MFTEAMLDGDVHPVNAPVKFCAQESFQVVSGIYFVAETSLIPPTVAFAPLQYVDW
jgi:hypothetical protein